MTDETPRFRAMHDTYNSLTGFGLIFDTQTMWLWRHWSARYKIEELELVVRYLQRAIKRGRYKECLGFRKLIGDLSNYDEQLSYARLEAKQSSARHEDMSDRSQTLRATGRPTQKERPVVKAGEISERLLNRNEFVAALKKLREEL